MATQTNSELFRIPARGAEAKASGSQPKKKIVRRVGRDYSQALRHGFQLAFLAWNVYLGAVFFLWVRQFETGRQATGLTRPSGAEGWLPIAGLMNLKYWLVTRNVPGIHPAAMFLLVTFLSVSFLFRKAFCSWLCPIGTVSEYLWRAGRKLVRRNLVLPRWVDVPLRGLKYLLLGFFIWAISSMSAEAIAGFMRSPYGLIADVKMLNFFRHMGETAAVILATLMIASLFVKNLWCRYFCPYGALLGLASVFSPTRIRRNPRACIDCGKCALVCPSSLPVDKLFSIKSAECTGCMECVAACPAQEALWAGLPGLTDRPHRRLPAWALAAGIALIFFGIIGYAKVKGYWNSNIPEAVYIELVPHADQAAHPMP